MDISRLVMIMFVYILLYSTIVMTRPSFIYNNQHDYLRQFGVGYKNTTILPLWLVSILLAIFSYFIVLYFMHVRYNCIFINT